jgi:hypothetical protein
MNCDDPAKTPADRAIAPTKDNPLVWAKVPKMMPKGIAPIISGMVCRTPAQNSPQAEAGGTVNYFVSKVRK